jgi:hypothetical protein
LEELGGESSRALGRSGGEDGLWRRELHAWVFGSAAPYFALCLLADGTRLYCRTAVRLEWPKMEGRFCVYVVDVWIFINIVVSCSLPTIGIESGLDWSTAGMKFGCRDFQPRYSPKYFFNDRYCRHHTHGIVNRMVGYMGF